MSDCKFCGKLLSPRNPYYCNNKCQGLARLYKNYHAKCSHFTARNYLFATTEHKCDVCASKEWMGKPIPLELDHVNGDWADNSLNNIRLICPNCHAQTPTYKNKNKGRGRKR